MANDANKLINGTFGRVWVTSPIGTELWAETKSLNAKVIASYEDINFCEELGTDKKFTGYAGEGTMVMYKMYSRGASLLANAFKTGIMPTIKMVTKIADPASFGAERVEILGVTFDEFTLVDFESKKVLEEELPFKFKTYNPLDLITP